MAAEEGASTAVEGRTKKVVRTEKRNCKLCLLENSRHCEDLKATQTPELGSQDADPGGTSMLRPVRRRDAALPRAKESGLPRDIRDLQHRRASLASVVARLPLLLTASGWAEGQKSCPNAALEELLPAYSNFLPRQSKGTSAAGW